MIDCFKYHGLGVMSGYCNLPVKPGRKELNVNSCRNCDLITIRTWD